MLLWVAGWTAGRRPQPAGRTAGSRLGGFLKLGDKDMSWKLRAQALRQRTSCSQKQGQRTSCNSVESSTDLVWWFIVVEPQKKDMQQCVLIMASANVSSLSGSQRLLIFPTGAIIPSMFFRGNHSAPGRLLRTETSTPPYSCCKIQHVLCQEILRQLPTLSDQKK